MRSIKKRVEAMKAKMPNGSSYLQFARAVTDRKFSRPVIARWFARMVEKDDYDRATRKAIIDHLVKISNPPEEEGFRGENRSGKSAN